MATGLGIDVGAQWIKVVQVQRSGGKITVTGAVKLPRHEVPAEGKASEESAGFSVPRSLGAELARLGLRTTGTVGVTGRDVVFKYLTVPPMPPERLKLYVRMQVGERLVSGHGQPQEEEEAPLTHDFRVLDIAAGLREEMVILAVAAQDDFLKGILNSLKAARVKARSLVPSGLALAQAFLQTQPFAERETVIVAEVGHERIEIAIVSEGNVYSVRCGPGGGQKFDQALEKVLKLPPDQVAAYKHDRGRIHPEGTPLHSQQDLQMQNALREGADSIANAVRTAMTFCRTQAKLPKLDYNRLILCGGGARLAGLKEYLQQKTQRPVAVLDLLSTVDVSKLDARGAACFEGDVSDMSVPLGLALLDADPSAFRLELLPAQVRQRRAFWNKTVFAAAAVLVLLAGLIPPYRNSVQSLREAEARKAEVEQEVKDAKKLRVKFEAEALEQKKFAQKVEYYARQTRMGQVYLNLYMRLREAAPDGMRLTSITPREEDFAGGLGEETFNAPLMRVLVKGYYDPDKIPDLNQAIDAFSAKLTSEKDGIGRPDLNPNPPTDPPPAGMKGYQFVVPLGLPVAGAETSKADKQKKAEPAPPPPPPPPPAGEPKEVKPGKDF